ncbi:IS3 family transposase [Pseudofulvimonas gallinarii]|uniref:IS3 family transposase n=1 Tax=Pseudofulvimonas gallinarii TaxID=634155 RepID=UPI003CCD86E6
MSPCGAVPRRLPPSARTDAATHALSARIIELAQVRRRFGYRRLHDLLRPEYPAVNHKKVYRLYRRRTWPCVVAGRSAGRPASASRCRLRRRPTRYGAWISSATRWPTGAA